MNVLKRMAEKAVFEEEEKKKTESPTQRVVVTDFNISFDKLVALIFKTICALFMVLIVPGIVVFIFFYTLGAASG